MGSPPFLSAQDGILGIRLSELLNLIEIAIELLGPISGAANDGGIPPKVG